MKLLKKISLTNKLLLVLAFSVIVSIGLYFCMFSSVSKYLDDTYYSDEHLASIENQKLIELQAYIDRNEIRSTNSEAIEHWPEYDDGIFMNIFKDGSLVYDTWNDYKFGVGYTYDEIKKLDYGTEKEVKFADGTAVVVMGCSFDEKLEKKIKFVLIIICALVCVSMVVVAMMKNIKEYRKIDILSHNLKTPLVPMQLYTELLKEMSQKDSKEYKYIKNIHQGIYELKNDIDNILHYKKNKRKVIEWIKFEYLLKEFDRNFEHNLEQIGWNVRKNRVDCASHRLIRYERALMQIVFNNLFININSYAEEDKEILVDIIEEEKYLCIRIENFIKFEELDHKGTGYGLGICSEIVNSIKGEFETYTVDNKFVAEVRLKKK